MLDPFVAIAGLLVGFVVGLTGMGGGALMTPGVGSIGGVLLVGAVAHALVTAQGRARDRVRIAEAVEPTN